MTPARLFPFPVVFASALGLALTLILALALSARAQSSMDLLGGARSAALGQSAAAIPGEAGVHVNPALRARITAGTATAYARQSHGLADLRYGAAHVALPLPGRWLDGTVAAVGASTFGAGDYRETHWTLGAARGFSLGTTRTAAVGVDLRYHHIHIAGYGSAGGVAVNPGIAVEVLPSLLFGAHATNLFGAALAAGVSLPQTLAVGLGYEASDLVLVVVEAVKDVDFPLSLRGGLELRPVPSLAIRAGGLSGPTRFTAGLGVRLGFVDADVAAERHADLGWSPSIGATVRWGR